MFYSIQKKIIYKKYTVGILQPINNYNFYYLTTFIIMNILI